MKRLLLVSCLVPLTALFGGCGEDPVTSPERAMFTSEVTTFTPVEVVQVSSDGTVKTTNISLESGVLYQVRVSGTVQSGGPGLMADAEFSDFSNVPGSLVDACDNAGTMVDVGLSINDPTLDNLKSPDWGAFSQAHTYTFDVIGQGQPLSFKFHDCNYSDNAGNFTVQVFRASEQNLKQLETVLVPAAGTPRTTSTVLQAGQTYMIRVSGTVNVGGEGTGTADAEFANFSDVPNSLADNCDNAGTLVDVGLAINDTQLDANRLPDWGGFNVGHVYEVEYIGTGAPITFSFHDCNYSDNTGNLVVQIYGPDGPVTPPPSGNFRTVETLQVPANCSSVSSTTQLEAGVTYQIRVSGTVQVGGPGSGTADAEFANFSNVPNSLMNNCDNLSTGIDIGLAIDDVDLDAAKFPNWGSFKQNHTYVTTVQGTGEPLSFSFHDCDCSDNSGNLAVEIRAPRTQGPGQGPRIDVRPGAARNFVNPKSHGMLMVAVLGGEDFDVNSLTVSSLSLAAGSSAGGAQPKNSRLRDVNRDGIMDLVLQFKINELNIQQTDTELCLSGLISGGESVDACDSIEVAGGKRGI